MLDLRVATNQIDKWSHEFLRDYGHDFPTIIEALITAEDHRATEHMGIDFTSLARASVRVLQGKKFGGVSTIEQQLARTIFPRAGRNLALSKAHELILSFRIARARPKQAVWCAYLMIAYYGTGLNGYASVRDQFCRTSRPVTKNQAAKITSCLKYPRPRSPSQSWRAAHRLRTDYVLQRWRSL